MNNKNIDDDLKIKIVRNFLMKLDYSDEAVAVYLSLIRNGPSTLLTISKTSGIERTRLYRMIDDLVKKGILEEVPRYKRKTVKAVDLDTIELMVKEKMSSMASLESNFDTFADAVKSISSSFIPGVSVVYYRGVEGIKQMTWHVLRTKGLWRAYSYRFWNDIFGDTFTLRLNKELIERKIKVHDLYSDQYIKYKEKWMKEKKKKPAGEWSFWDARYVSEKLVKIDQNIDIYNDVVAYAYWDGNDIFGVEIQNQRVADMQKQIHDHLWKLGKRIDRLDWANPNWS
jgi:predicted transcriptional regulator